MFDQLKTESRLLLEVELTPVQGERFQPTGFPDIGAAVYKLPDGTRKILVESAQSMANRLEQTILKGEGPEIAPQLEGLPYILVNLTGETDAQTSSLVEPHRINSPYITKDDDKFQDKFKIKINYTKGKHHDIVKFAKALLHYDVNSLVHGVFMSTLKNCPIKIPRALTGFIEAEGVEEVESGGVKFDYIDPQGEIKSINSDKNDVYGNIPYPRMEYTAKKIKAFFNLDLSLLRGYELDDDGLNLIIAFSLYKVRRFLSTGLRLRTSCNLEMTDEIKVTNVEGFKVPSEHELLNEIKKCMKACNEKGYFANPPVTVLTTTTVLKKKKDEESQ